MLSKTFGSLALSRLTSIESVVKNLIGMLMVDEPEAEVVGVQVFLDGLSGKGFEIEVEGKKLPVTFTATSNENMAGWVRLVYSQGIYESVATSVELENWP